MRRPRALSGGSSGLWALPLALVLVVGGCLSDEDQVTNMEKKPSEKSYASDGTTVNDLPEAEGGDQAGAQPVQVTLAEDRIQMPGSVPAGPTTFEVTNEGNAERRFEIAGPGVEQRLATPLKQYEVQTLTVDLEPGTYRVSTGDRTARGLETTLTVTRPGTPGTPQPGAGAPSTGTGTPGGS